MHRLQYKLRELYGAPAAGRAHASRTSATWPRWAARARCTSCALPYAGRDWHMAAKDVNFSKGSIDWRWDQGYADGMRAMGDAAWLRHIEEDTAVVVHELPSARDRRRDPGRA